MSTRSFIGISRKGRKIEGIYCHHDGYLSYVGKCLVNHYKDRETVNKLMKLGDLSVLGTHPVGKWDSGLKEDKDGFYTVCENYRSRGGDMVDSRIFENDAEYINSCADSWGEYAYLYKNREWYYKELHDPNSSWKLVKDRLET